MTRHQCLYTYLSYSTAFCLLKLTEEAASLEMCSLPQNSVHLYTSTVGCPVTGPQVEPSPEILPGSATVTWQAAQTSDSVLTTGMLYAVYSLCGSETSSYQLVAEAIEGLSYTVTGLPAPAQCALRVVAYHRYCLQDLDGDLRAETLPFTTAIAGRYRES